MGDRVRFQDQIDRAELRAQQVQPTNPKLAQVLRDLAARLRRLQFKEVKP